LPIEEEEKKEGSKVYEEHNSEYENDFDVEPKGNDGKT